MRYYQGSQRNEPLIAEKRGNLLMNDVLQMDDDRPAVPTIAEHFVEAEGLGAWYDRVLQRGADDLLVADGDALEKRIGVVDIGGKTTDIALIANWRVQTERSGSVPIGLLNVYRHVGEAVARERGGEPPSARDCREIVWKGSVLEHGKLVDRRELRDKILQDLIRQIKIEVDGLFAEGRDIDEVLFVGGGAAVFEDHVTKWFPNGMVADQPGFANARGFMLAAEVRMREKDRAG